MTTEELRRAVHGDVRAQGDRLLQERRGEGVIDGHHRTAGSRRGAESGHVGDIEQRVGRGFQPEQIRVTGCSRDASRVGYVDQLDVPAPVLLAVGQQGLNAGIAVRGRHYPGARAQHVEHGRCGTHS